MKLLKDVQVFSVKCNWINLRWTHAFLVCSIHQRNSVIKSAATNISTPPMMRNFLF